MNTYTDTNSGIKYTQKQIDYNLTKAKKELRQEFTEEHGAEFCLTCYEEFNRGEVTEKELTKPERASFIDCSHNKSIKWCKENSEIELIWSKENMELLCRYHHEQKDGLTLQFKKVI